MTNQRGFTIVEVLVAVLVLSVGVIALAGSAGLVTRMIGQGQRYTVASTLANEQIEIIRAEGCPAGGAVDAAGSRTEGAYTLAWRTVAIQSGRGRLIQVAVQSPTTRGTRTDTFTSVEFCPL